MNKIASYAELLAWKDGGVAPSADSVIALVGNLSAQIEEMLSRIPPGRDEDLEEGVTRFRTLGQLRADGVDVKSRFHVVPDGGEPLRGSSTPVLLVAEEGMDGRED